jgi:hypothetical protein
VARQLVVRVAKRSAATGSAKAKKRPCALTHGLFLEFHALGRGDKKLFRRSPPLAAHNTALAGDHVTWRGPSVALEGADQVPHRPGVLGGAARPDKSRFNPAVIYNRGSHGFLGGWLFKELDANAGGKIKISW